jgi:hypothetical protein
LGVASFDKFLLFFFTVVDSNERVSATYFSFPLFLSRRARLLASTAEQRDLSIHPSIFFFLSVCLSIYLSSVRSDYRCARLRPTCFDREESQKFQVAD